MNEKQFESKMVKDGTNVKKAVDNMVEDGVSQLKSEYDEFRGLVKDNVNSATSSIKKEVNHGMKQYNAKAHDVVENLPFDLNHSVSKYPWVVISFGLLFGLILGFLLKPSRQSR
jgi:ElaB/YqjD/DUF883 family membrane-anchored ribosome-binding protein